MIKVKISGLDKDGWPCWVPLSPATLTGKWKIVERDNEQVMYLERNITARRKVDVICRGPFNLFKYVREGWEDYETTKWVHERDIQFITVHEGCCSVSRDRETAPYPNQPRRSVSNKVLAVL